MVYGAEDRLVDVVSERPGVPTTYRTYTRNARGEVIGVQEDGVATESYAFNAHSERLGTTEGYGRILDQGNSVFEYDNEGNIVVQKTHDMAARQEFFALPSYGLALANKPAQSLTTGSYRIRVTPAEFNFIGGVPASVAKALVSVEVRKGGVSVLARQYYALLERTGISTLAFTDQISYDLEVSDNDTYDVSTSIVLVTAVERPIITDGLNFSVTSGELVVERASDYYFNKFDHQNRIVETTQRVVTRNADGTLNIPTATTGKLINRIEFTYDALGNRIGKKVFNESGFESDLAFVPEGGKTLLEYRKSFDGTATLVRERMYADDQLLAVDSGEIGNKTVWVLPDYQGSVSNLYAFGEHTSTARYDSYGRLHGQEGTLLGQVSVGFLGMELDSQTQRYFAGDRYYDPYAGRYLSESAGSYLAGATNLYIFAGNSPADRSVAGGSGINSNRPINGPSFTAEYFAAMSGGVQADGIDTFLYRAGQISRTVGILAGTAAGIIPLISGVGSVAGGVIFAGAGLYGIDQAQAGVRSTWSSQSVGSIGGSLIQSVLGSGTTAAQAGALSYDLAGLAFGGASLLRNLTKIGRMAPVSAATPSARWTAIREALSDNSGRLLTRAERSGVKHTIRRVEQLGYEVTGSVKYGANHGIDLTFKGVGQGTSRIALAEAKAGRGLGSLEVDSLGIRQGSYRFFETRLQRGGRLDLLQELQSGNAELFGGFARSGRLYRFDPTIFFDNVNFRRTPGAATLVP